MKIKSIFLIPLLSFFAIYFLHISPVQAFEKEITSPRAGESILPGETFTIAGYQEVGLTSQGAPYFESCAIAYVLSTYTIADIPHNPQNVRERTYQHFFGYREGNFSKKVNTNATKGYYPYIMRCEGSESFQMPNINDLPVDIQTAVSDGEPVYIFFYPIYYNNADGQTYGVNQGSMTRMIYIGNEGNDLPVGFITNPKKDGSDFSEGVVEIELEVGDSIMLSGRGEDADGTIEAYEWRESREDDVVSYRSSFFVDDWPRVQEYGLTVVDDDGARSENFPIVRVTFVEKELFVCPSEDISLDVGDSSSLRSYYSNIGACRNCQNIQFYQSYGILPQDCSNITNDSTWMSSNGPIASVDNGIVEGLKGGDTKISARHSGVSSNEVNVNVTASNTAPSLPTISGPTTLEINESGDYTFSGSRDPEDDNIQYRVDWGDGSIDNFPSCSGDGSCSVTASKSWPTQGNKTIQAQACDANNACSGWRELDVSVSQKQLLLHLGSSNSCSGQQINNSNVPLAKGTWKTITVCDKEGDKIENVQWSFPDNSNCFEENPEITTLPFLNPFAYVEFKPEDDGTELCEVDLTVSKNNYQSAQTKLIIKEFEPGDPTPIEVEGARWKEVAP
jgi:hypothetical protein